MAAAVAVVHRDNDRDVRILKGGLEAVIELSANIGAFYVGATGRDKISGRYPLATEAPDTLILYYESEDQTRDEAFAILRVGELLKAKGCKPLRNTKPEKIIHEKAPSAGFVYVKCHKNIAPSAITFSHSMAIAEASISADMARHGEYAKIEEAFSRKKAETLEVLTTQLGKCSLMSPTKQQQNFSDIFSAAEKSLHDAFSDEDTTMMRTIVPLIEFKKASMKKLESLLGDDAAFLRRLLDSVVRK